MNLTSIFFLLFVILGAYFIYREGYRYYINRDRILRTLHNDPPFEEYFSPAGTRKQSADTDANAKQVLKSQSSKDNNDD